MSKRKVLSVHIVLKRTFNFFAKPSRTINSSVEGQNFKDTSVFPVPGGIKCVFSGRHSSASQLHPVVAFLIYSRKTLSVNFRIPDGVLPSSIHDGRNTLFSISYNFAVTAVLRGLLFVIFFLFFECLLQTRAFFF